MSQETRGRDSARAVKIIAALLMFVSIPGCITAATVSSDGVLAVSMIIFALGFIGFIVGRFME